MKVSVCMATYNGGRYVQEQIASILHQLDSKAELIIVDDASQDNTLCVANSFGDSRIKVLHNGQNQGVIRTFNRGLASATGDVIFLCDQDDIWAPNKVELVLDAFDRDPRVTLVFTNTQVIDENGQRLGRPFRGMSRSWGGILVTLIANRYVGCTMAFRKVVCQAALPIPTGIPMHDSWIALVNAFIGRTQFIDSELVLYRRHSSNATARSRLSLADKLSHRWALCKNLALRAPKLFNIQATLNNSRISTT